MKYLLALLAASTLASPVTDNKLAERATASVVGSLVYADKLVNILNSDWAAYDIGTSPTTLDTDFSNAINDLNTAASNIEATVGSVPAGDGSGGNTLTVGQAKKILTPFNTLAGDIYTMSQTAQSKVVKATTNGQANNFATNINDYAAALGSYLNILAAKIPNSNINDFAPGGNEAQSSLANALNTYQTAGSVGTG